MLTKQDIILELLNEDPIDLNELPQGFRFGFYPKDIAVEDVIELRNEIATQSSYLNKSLGVDNEKRLLDSFINNTDRSLFFVIDSASNKPIAFVFIIYNPKTKSCTISLLAVSPRYQQRGIGRCIINKVRDNARKLKYKQLELSVDDTNKPARRLYSSLGFKITKTVKMHDMSVNI